jgi:hypothetical protein
MCRTTRINKIGGIKRELEKFNKLKQQLGYCKGNFWEWGNTRRKYMVQYQEVY